MKVSPQLLAHVEGHGVLYHDPVQVVHRPPELHLVRSEGREDATHSANHISPDGGGERRTEGGDPVLHLCLRGDIAVADARQRDDGPVQRYAVDLFRPLVDVVGAALGLAQGRQPGELALSHSQGAPQAGHPVAAEDYDAEELHQGEGAVAQTEGGVPSLRQAREPRKPQQAEEASAPHHPQLAEGVELLDVPRPAVQEIQIHRQQADKVDQEPAREVVPHDPHGVSDHDRRARRVGNRDAALQRHVDEEGGVAQPVHREQNLYVRIQKCGFEGGEQARSEEKGRHEHVPNEEPRRSEGVDGLGRQQATSPPPSLVAGVWGT
mmetsp:Transcript_114727/g.331542  ORF Transcript_114727/g.331542 Transcript_114727/m.331542 type:complete len:322 (-) Transcript_114727:135-1100(-)